MLHIQYLIASYEDFRNRLPEYVRDKLSFYQCYTLQNFGIPKYYEVVVKVDKVRVAEPSVGSVPEDRPMTAEDAILLQKTYALLVTCRMTVAFYPVPASAPSVGRRGPCLLSDGCPFMELDTSRSTRRRRRRRRVVAGKAKKEFESVLVAKVPRMVYDPRSRLGGYFIVNGKAKYVVGQIVEARNSICVYVQKNHIAARLAYSVGTRSGPYSTGAFRIMPYYIDKNTTIPVVLKRNGCVVVSDGKTPGTPFRKKREWRLGWAAREKLAGDCRPRSSLLCISPRTVPTGVPVLLLFRALGLTDKDVFHLVCFDAQEIPNPVLSAAMEREFIYAINDGLPGNRAAALARLRGYLGIGPETDPLARVLPHLESVEQKAHTLGDMCRRLLLVLCGAEPVDDRDSMRYRRTVSAASYLHSVTDDHLSAMRQHIYKLVAKSLDQETDPEGGDGYPTQKATPNFNKLHTLLFTGVRGRANGMVRRFMHKRKVGRRGIGIGGSTTTISAAAVFAGVDPCVRHLRCNNAVDVMSCLTEIVLPKSRGAKSQPKPRMLHPTEWGYMCAVESPEGKSCGMVGHFGMNATVSLPIDPAVVKYIEGEVRSMVTPLGIQIPAPLRRTRVYFDGKIVGHSGDPQSIMLTVKAFKYISAPLRHISVSRDFEKRTLDIWTEENRHIRPVRVCLSEDGGGLAAIAAVVAKLRGSALAEEQFALLQVDEDIVRKLDMAWRRSANSGMGVVECTTVRMGPRGAELLKYDLADVAALGGVEWIDPLESENALIATYEHQLTDSPQGASYTHIELEGCASTVLGVAGGLVPYANHDQSPRVTFVTGMMKQAIGPPLPPPLNCHGAVQRRHELWYPEHPVVSTMAYRELGLSALKTGSNVMMAFMAFGGYDQEDAIIFNRSSLERDLFSSFDTTTVVVEVDRKHEELCDPAMKCQTHNYNHLGPDWIIDPGSPWRRNTVLVAKQRKQPPGRAMSMASAGPRRRKPKNTSVIARIDSMGHVKSVRLQETDDREQLIIHIELQIHRIPEIGDKFTTRHGQKGVIGMLYSQEDMPWEHGTGVVPDVIVNPHCIPSRMTIGQLLEVFVGNLGLAFGLSLDGTPFSRTPNVHEVSKAIRERNAFPGRARGAGAGFSGCNRILCNPNTGMRYKESIFMGPVYLMQLNRRVQNQIHCRSRGPRALLTRQPVKGRKRMGGYRVSEMQRDSLISHGAAQMLNERLFTVSDPYYIAICNTCRRMVVSASTKDMDDPHEPRECRHCMRTVYVSDGSMSWVPCPYAMKLLYQELMTMGVQPIIETY